MPGKERSKAEIIEAKTEQFREPPPEKTQVTKKQRKIENKLFVDSKRDCC